MMRIGDVAQLSGVSAKLIRHYEFIGLLRTAEREANGYRAYSDTDVHELRFIKRARLLGFPIETIRELLSLWRDQSRPSRKVRALAETHLRFLDDRIAATEQMAATLRRLIKACSGDHRPDCPILEDLSAGRNPKESHRPGNTRRRPTP
jgi:Cu(I)-responsive transcriptional regulator